MIRLFPKSIKFIAMTLTVAAILATLFATLSHDLPFAILILFVGGWIAFLGGQYQAITSHQKLLQILYNERDPDRFLAVYRPLADRCSPQTKLGSAMRAQIGNALIAKGEFAQAFPCFEGGSDSPDTRIMQAQNRCTCFLYQGDTGGAQRELTALDPLLAQAKPRQRQLYSEGCRMLRVWLSFECNKLKPDDLQWLRTESACTNKPLHRSTTRLLLARIYRAQGDLNLARNLAQNIVDDGGHIWAVEQAKLLLETVPQK